GVADAAVLWLRSQVQPEPGPLITQASAPATAAASPESTAEPDSYVVPQTPERRAVVPSTDLANYVVAHSEFSSPVARRNLLSAFMASESGTAGTPAGSDEPVEDAQDNAKTTQ